MIGDQSWASHGRNVSVGQWAASHVLTGLTPHLTYAVRLMAHNDLGVSQPSPLQMFTTTEEGKYTPHQTGQTWKNILYLLHDSRAPDRYTSITWL